MANDEVLLTRREARLNGWLTVALLAGIVALVNAIAAERLVVRRDLSADQLYAVSPATTRILRGLEDRLQVRTFFTRETELGEVALARARVEAQLEEFRALARGRMEVVDFDPARSSQARDEARRAGIQPRPQRRVQGTQAVTEEVWLGLTLRYRGREQAIPFAEPWRFEVQFAGAVHALRRDRRVVVGLLNAPTAAPSAELEDREWPTFGLVAQQLGASREVRPVTGLAEGRPVPEDVDVLLVVASSAFHPREAFEIDRFVQRGGSVIVAVDDPVFGSFFGRARLASPEGPLDGELRRVLAAWGARLYDWHVWDTSWATEHPVVRFGANGQPVVPPPIVRSPAVITVPEEGLAQELPPTRDLRQVTFWWAHPIDDARRFPPPDGVRREDLVVTSERAKRLGQLGEIPYSATEIDRMTRALVAEPAGEFVLAAAFTGALPSAFAGRPAPEPRNPLGGGVAPSAPPPPPSGTQPGTAIVVGDADWLRDPAFDGVLMGFAAAGGALLVENLVDWLTLDDDLIALRSRVPRERPLADFEEEEAVAAGLMDAYPTEAERVARMRLRDEVERRAARRRWAVMLRPILIALGVVAAVGLAWNLRERRRVSAQGGRS